MTGENWLKSLTDSPEGRREFEQERLIVEATELVYRMMENAGMSKADLARTLGTSRAYVTQMLSGSRNMTLRTLSDFAWACAMRVALSCERLHEDAFVSVPMHIVRAPYARVVKTQLHAQQGTVDTDPEKLAA